MGLSESPSGVPDSIPLQVTPNLSNKIYTQGESPNITLDGGTPIKLNISHGLGGDNIDEEPSRKYSKFPEEAYVPRFSKIGFLERGAGTKYTGIDKTNALFTKGGGFNHAPSKYTDIPKGTLKLAQIAEQRILKSGEYPGNLPDNLKHAYYATLLSIDPNIRGGIDLFEKYPQIRSLMNPHQVAQVRELTFKDLQEGFARIMLGS